VNLYLEINVYCRANLSVVATEQIHYTGLGAIKLPWAIIIFMWCEALTGIAHWPCIIFFFLSMLSKTEYISYLTRRVQSGQIHRLIPVLAESDNDMLLAPPDKKEIKDTLDDSNLHAAPGTDGLTSFLYNECWHRS
jgi:hypothetical protein